MSYDINVKDLIRYLEDQGCIITKAKEGQGGFFIDGKPIDLAELFKSGACENCSNNPKNGGSGFCQCVLGQKVIY